MPTAMLFARPSIQFTEDSTASIQVSVVAAFAIPATADARQIMIVTTTQGALHHQLEPLEEVA